MPINDVSLESMLTTMIGDSLESDPLIPPEVITRFYHEADEFGPLVAYYNVGWEMGYREGVKDK